MKAGDEVYILDSLSYDARGGTGSVHATLEGAMAAAPNVRQWIHEVWDHPSFGRREAWHEWCEPGSARDIWEIRVEEVHP